MPSLFSRARTTSTSKPSQTANGTDEFGRVPTPLRNKSSFTTPTKKDKKDRSARSRAVSTPDPDAQELFSEIPDGSFLPLNLNPPHFDIPEREVTQDYGYLSHKRHVVLGLEEISRLVDVAAQEICSRGLTTPFIFSALALDVSAPATTRLIEAFLHTCNSMHPSVEQKWREEAQFTGPHELGMFLRWGLARAVRVVGGLEVRGLLNYESYVDWRDSESAMNYPPAFFANFLDILDPTLQAVLITLLTLLSRLSAHSASSGHTPPTLSPLFGPLLFGLGPSSLSFHHAYHRYLRATNATEHLILAFIRWQDATTTTGLGVPARLKDWIRGYPSMLPSLPTQRQERPLPRKGAKTVRVATVRRNVRMYSPDLVKTAAGWATRPKGLSEMNSLTNSKVWERISPPSLHLPPRYSESYGKRMNLPPSFNPDIGPGVSSLQSSFSSASSVENGPLLNKPGEDRFRSLTDLKWGEFEASGFGNVLADDKKLQFDLTEGARAARRVKRQTLTWNDFSQAGFSRMDDPLNTTLQFSTPVAATINQWPTQNAEISRKLKKTQKSLPPFGWDTEPVMASEEVIEEAFVDVFCDLVYGGGWMDIERGEDIDRECNWALVEYKSLPVSRSNTISGAGDPRTSTTLILYEEFVPLEYRQKLAASGSSRKRLPSFFSSKSKQWKPAATLNGKPYTLGSVPASPSYREVEFEGILRAGNTTRVIKVDPKNSKPVASPLNKSVSSPDHPSPRQSGPLFTTKSDSPAYQPEPIQIEPIHMPIPAQTPPIPSRSPIDPGEETPTKQKLRFRIPGGLPVGGPASTRRRSGLPPAEYDTIDFETRLASYSDDELNGGLGRPMTQQEKRRSRDDAWVDILVSGSSRRLGGQDAVMKTRRSDPDLAKQEVAQVFATVSPPSDDEQDEIVMEPIDAPARFSAENPPSSVDHGPFGTNTTEEEEVAPASRPRRVGYFDLHPERRRGGIPGAEDDPRTRLAYDDSDSEVDYPRKDSLDWSQQDEDNERDPHAPAPVQNITPPRALPSKPEVKPSPPHTNGEGQLSSPAVITHPQQTSTKSKTSSLIEMYREKEKAAIQPAPQPARLSPQPPASPQPIPQHQNRPLSSPLPKPGPSGIPPPPPRTPSPNPSEDLPAQYDQSPNGPGRYVHGAPLHNVVEEEEE